MLINVAIMAGGVALLFAIAHNWDHDRPVAISCLVAVVLYIAAMLFLGPGPDGT